MLLIKNSYCFLFVLMLALGSLPAFSKDKTIGILVHVRDAFTRETLEAATVTILDEDSTQIAVMEVNRTFADNIGQMIPMLSLK